MGPKKDIYGEIARAVRKYDDMKLLATFHHARTFGYATGNLKKMKITDEMKKTWDIFDPQYNDFYWNKDTGATVEKFSDDWKAKIKEVIDNYKPDLIWFDGLSSAMKGMHPPEPFVREVDTLVTGIDRERRYNILINMSPEQAATGFMRDIVQHTLFNDLAQIESAKSAKELEEKINLLVSRLYYGTHYREIPHILITIERVRHIVQTGFNMPGKVDNNQTGNPKKYQKNTKEWQELNEQLQVLDEQKARLEKIYQEKSAHPTPPVPPAPTPPVPPAPAPTLHPAAYVAVATCAVYCLYHMYNTYIKKDKNKKEKKHDDNKQNNNMTPKQLKHTSLHMPFNLDRYSVDGDQRFMPH